MGKKVKTFFFCESDHVAYQIIEKEVQNNMQALCLTLGTRDLLV